jgi:hypothetical protein
MRALKAAVIVMGVMIVIASIMLAIVIANRLSSRSAATMPIEASLDQPPGTRIVGVASVGERLAVHVTGGGLPDRIVFVEATRGQVVGTLVPEAPPAGAQGR